MGNEYDPTMTRWGTVVAVSALAVFAACSSSGDSRPADTTIATTAVVATTESPTTSTTSTPPTTQPPTTTIDPTAALAAEVEADLLEAFRLGREAWQDPFNSQKEAAALDRRIGVVRDNLETSLADYRERNLALRPSDTTVASVTVEGVSEFVGVNNEVAEVTVCEVNSWILVEVGAGPDGADAIVDPEVVITRSEVFMRNVDGTWKLEGGNLLAEWQGGEQCPDE